MYALLRRFTDRAGEITGDYSKDFSKKASALSERAGEFSDSAMARLGHYGERAREQANRVYSTALDHPKTTYSVLGIVALGVVAAGVWGIWRYREQQRLARSRARGGAQRSSVQRTRGKRVKAGQSAAAT
jgi:hypothetical protein